LWELQRADLQEGNFLGMKFFAVKESSATGQFSCEWYFDYVCFLDDFLTEFSILPYVAQLILAPLPDYCLRLICTAQILNDFPVETLTMARTVHFPNHFPIVILTPVCNAQATQVLDDSPIAFLILVGIV
jgi:hypothetical protein